MAVIFMHVRNKTVALETLLYVFKNQMGMGKNKLILTVIHNDGRQEHCTGNIDKVFKSDALKEIECFDMILLEHYDTNHNDFFHLEGEIDSNGGLIDAGINIDRCCYFYIKTKVIFALIKDNPLYTYNIFRNEIISDKVFGAQARVLNNMACKLTSHNGLTTMLTINNNKR